MVLTFLILTLLCYLLGAVPSVAVIGLRRKHYLMRHPSPVQVLGFKRGLGLVAIDFGKGVLAPLFGLIVAGWCGACLAALAVNIGVVFSVFQPPTHRRKNTATAAGSLLVLSPVILLIGVIVFIFMLVLTQFLSLSAIISTLIILVLVLLYPPTWYILLVIFLLGIMMLVLHGESFSRLRKGQESPIPIRRWFR